MVQDILITPGITEPQILFRGSGASTTAIELNVLAGYQSASGVGSALVFEGTEGQLFAITDNLSTGTIFSVSDISGLPLISVDASGGVHLGEYADTVTVYPGLTIDDYVPATTTNKLYNDGGSLKWNGITVVESGASQVVDGTGTASYIAKWTDTNTIGTGVIYDDGTNVGIGTTNPQFNLDVEADLNSTTYIRNYNTNAGSTAGAGILAQGDNAKSFFISHAVNRVSTRYGFTLGNTTEIAAGGNTASTEGLVIGTLSYDKPIIFGNDDTERMRIDVGGNIGIGTTSPFGLFDVQQNTVSSLLSRLWNTNTSGTGSSVFRITNSGNNAYGSRIEFSDTNYYVGTITADRTNGIQFFTGNQSAATDNFRMVIDPDGDVGIGTSAPNAKLHVYNATSGADVFNAEGSSGSLFSVTDDLSGTLMSVNTISGFPVLEVNSDYSITAGRFNQNDFVLTTGGDIGIGTDGPSSKLEVQGTATATSFLVPGGGSNQFLKADGSIDSTAYTTCAGTVTSVAAGNGLNFTTITGSGSVVLGTPGSTTLSSTNAVTTTSHTHAFAPGGTTAQYIRGDGSLSTFPTIPTVNNGTLTMGVSGTGLTGSASFTANQSGNSSFTVTSNATSLNTASTIVSRDASGNFSAGTITANLSGNATTATTATTATNANNINISATTSTDTTSSIVLVGAQSTGNQSPFIDSGLSYNSDTNALTAGSFVKTSGTNSQFLKADGSVDSTAYTTCAGTVTSVAAGNGLNFTTITGSGSVVLGTPGSTTLSSTNAVSATSHTHAFAPGGTTAQYIRGDGSLATFPSIPTVNNGTLTMGVSGTGLTGSATFTANQSGGSTFTVSSNATSANTVSTIVARDASGNFSAGTITASLSGTATNANNINISATTSTDTTTSIVLVANQSTGNQSPFIDSGIAYNANTNALTAGSFVKTSGTSSQFLKADGSVDSTSYQASSTALTTSTNFGGDVSGTYNSIVVADDSHNHVISNVDGLQTALNNKLETSLKGANSGLAELDATGKVPSAQLPSFVDDVLEYANVASFPTTGETGKIYVALDTNLTYRWGGTSYVEISASLALGETSTTAYRGDRGKTAYDHSQATSGSVHGSTTVGGNLLRLTNPSAIRFLRINADNSISTLTDADFRAAIGAGTSSTTGTVTSVGGTGTVSGISLSGTVTTSGNLTLSGTLSVTPSNFASQTAKTFLAAPNASNGVPSFRTIVASDVPTLNQNTTGSAGSISRTVAAGTDANLVYASVAANDFFRIRVGGASNAAYAEIATADDGTEPIYVRQYTGVFATVARTATLLNSSGNTSFPGSVTGNSFVKSGGTSSQFLKADGSVDSTSYTTCAGTVTSVAAGNGLNFTTITGSGSVVLGTPGSTTLSSTNAVTTTSHTHAFAPGGSTSQYIRGDGSLATFPSIPTVNNGTLTMGVSGTGLTGSATFTANQSGNSTFTVSSNATSANTASTIVARDASGNFSAGTITANQVNVDNLRLDGSTLSNTYTDGNINILPNGTGGINLGSCNTIVGSYPTVTGGLCNCVTDNYATVSGGYTNIATDNSSTIGGGSFNCATCTGATVAGGGSNCACHTYATVGGGVNNHAYASSSTVSGGHLNCACATFSAIGGGWTNITNSRFSVISGGQYNVLYCVTNECCIMGATIGGGLGHNTVGGTVDAGGQLSGVTSCLSAGSYSTIGGGYRNCATSDQSTIAGGANNYAVGCQSTIAGGNTNKTTGIGAFVGGGGSNCACSNYSSIVGGVANSISSACSAIAGGSYNCIQGELSAIVAGYYNCNCSNRSFIGSGFSNTVSGQYSTIIGGCCNNDCGFSNTHILGSNICATQANTTYTEKLLVSDTASANCTIFSVEGTNGSLFGVTDSLSGVLMSVNTVAGLPVMEVNSDYSVVAGRYSQDDFVITSGGDVGIGTNAPSTKLEVSGSVTATSFIKSGGTSSQFLKADGSVDSTSYTSCAGTVTSVAAGNGLNFTTITGSGSVTLGTPGSTTLSSTNAVTTTSHTHAFAPGGTTAQYIRGDGSLATFPSIPTVNNGTLTMGVSGTGLTGSASFTANQSGNSTFTVSSNATSANTASTIVARDASGNFSAGTITATQVNVDNLRLDGNTLSSTNTNGNVIITPNGTGGIAAGTSPTVTGPYATVGGGYVNSATGSSSTVSGGYCNLASGNYSSIAGGCSNNTCGFSNTHILGSNICATQANTTYTEKLLVSDTASANCTIFNVEGTNGSLFSIVDSLSGVLMSVNNNAGLPIFEVYDNDSIIGGRYNQNDFVVTTGGNVGIGTNAPSTKFEVSGSATATSFIKSGGTSSQFLKANGSVDSTAYTTCAGTVTSVAAGNGLNFTTITGSGSVTLGTPGSTTLSSTNAVTSTSHTHAFAPGGTTAQYIRGNGSLATFPTIPTVNNGTLTLGVSGTGLSGSATFTANQSSGSTFTVTSNATSANTASTIVARDSSGNFSAGTITATQVNVDNLRLDGNTLSSTNTNGNINITPNGTGGIAGGTSATVTGNYATVSGGYGNCASGNCSTVGGGCCNTASGNNSTVGGGGGCLYGFFDLSNTASGFYSTVGGGGGNCASGFYSTVSGGSSNCASDNSSTVSGGGGNCACGPSSTVSGGGSNTASGCNSTVGGGYGNTASGNFSTVSGGGSVFGGNTASGCRSTVGGGTANTASGIISFIGGGDSNTACGKYSTVSGGYRAKASRYGEVAHAAGQFAQQGDAQHSTFVARKNTTDATANVELFLNGVDDRMVLTAETTWTFDIKLSAYNDTDNTAAWWKFTGGIKRNAANVTSLIGDLFEITDCDAGMSNAAAAVSADDTNESLKIAVTGLASKNIRWVAVVDVTQVSWGTP